ncbi:methyltransferase domain-containing protein [Desertibaculum subflavum]|uniref:methyltransferase domain-containing protein n=1 Tax=Desertibaculum subflavum TaxID=2268458 RepID=UPI000E6734F3
MQALAARVRRKAMHGAGRAMALAGILPGPRFRCPVCGFIGSFPTTYGANAPRRYCRCPKCGAAERHRLQRLVIERIRDRLPAGARGLQFAPDPMTPVLCGLCADFITADIMPRQGSIVLDMTRMELPDDAFDLVYASHVLEHIPADRAAIAQVHRILKPGGIAILPVPIVAPKTVEYPPGVTDGDGHVRAPGLDYYDRYRERFAEVELVTSAEVDQATQPWIYEDRTIFPNATATCRPAMPGERHLDAVPICRK